MARLVLTLAIVCTLACGRSREVVSSQSTAAPTTPTTTAANDRSARTNETRVAGQVTGLAGACPALTFTIRDTKVATAQSTKFDRGGCSGVANGASVRVEGVKQTDGSIQATRVEVITYGRP